MGREARRPFGPFVAATGRIAAGTGLPPDAFTVLALLVSLVGAVLVGLGRFVPGALVAVFGVCLDFVDGAVARHTEQVTSAGGYLDSMFDRYADFALFFAVAVAYDTTRMWWAMGLALFGVLMTSAAKWRLHADVRPADGRVSRAIVERPARLVILLVGVFAQGLLVWRGVEVDVLFGAVVVVAVLANVAVVQRMRAALRLLREA